MSLSIPGIIDWDLRRQQTRTASCAGVVRQVCIKPHETVARGDTVLKFESAAAITAQERLIRALNAFEAHCDFSRVEEVRWARHDLARLKFTKKQIKRVEETRRVQRQLAIVSPWTGLVVQVAAHGRGVEVDTALFAVATERLVLCAAPAEMPDEDLLRLQVASELGAVYAHRGAVRVEQCERGGRRVYFRFAWPKSAPPIGAHVDVKPLPPAPPTPPPLLLRGIDYRLMRHAEDPSYPLFPERTSRSMMAEDLERDAQRLALREAWLPSSIDASLPEARRQETAAADLVFGDSAWRAQAIETAVVREVAFVPNVRTLGIVETIRPAQQRLSVRAPCDGWCEPGGVEAGHVLEVGALLARMRRHADAGEWRPLAVSADECLPHKRDLVSVRAVRDELHVVLGQRCLVRSPPSRGATSVGSELARLHALPWLALRCVVPAEIAARLPVRVRVRVATANTKRVVSEFIAVLLPAPARRSGEALLYVPLPESADGWQPGAAYEVTLADDTATRTVLAAPADCVARLGRATEVLAHTARGQLTRRTVVVGAAQDDLVEIAAGLVEGDVLVRELGTRMKWFPRFQAAMVGVWTPAHQTAALLRSVDEG